MKNSLATLALLTVQICRAQLISVDINGSARSDVNAPGFSPWNLVSGSSATFTNYSYSYDPDTGAAVTTNVTRIGCKLTQISPSASSTMYLDGEYVNKDGNETSTDPDDGWRLSMDGCRVRWKDDGTGVDQACTNNASFSLTISNLSAGVHTITTYHNDPYPKPGSIPAWHGTRVMSRCIISVNGTPVFTNTPTVYATNDSKCGFAFFTVSNSYDGQPVVLTFAPDHSSLLDFVILNGFEVDRPSPPGTTAMAVFPLSNDEHAFANNDAPLPGTANAGYLTLQWKPAGFAISNHVYFGTNQGAIINATMASPEFKLASAATFGGTNTLSVNNLNSALTYYWRVDQLNISNGQTNLVKGAVWMFRTRHLAFPGAEGYGRFSRGGRGGRVIEVVNLNDSGAGSYRAAVQSSGPRTVVFKVSGLIRLNGPCVIGTGNLTVAGQTAPGDGISLCNWRAGITSASDVTMRFMRMRLGDGCKQAMDGIGLGNSTHSIIDHTSIAWTMDEGTSSRQSGRVGSQSCMITFQNNLIAEPLQFSYHYDGNNRDYCEPHAFAGSISGEIGSYLRNLIAHSTDRNWSLAGGLDQSGNAAGSLDIRNNVVYNWYGRTTDGGVARANFVNNYYKSFPSSPSAKYFLKADSPSTGQQYYMTGNVMTGVSGQGDVFTDNWKNGGYYQGAEGEALQRVNSEFFPSYATSLSASNAYKVVLSDSGCNLPVPDAIDVRIVGEAMDHTTHYIGTNANPYVIDGVVQLRSGVNRPGFIDSQNDVKDYQSTNSSLANYSANAPWPPYRTYNVPVDTDHDGLPDWWERIKGFNTNSPANDFSDSNSDVDGDGYTALEDYLNWMAGPHHGCTNAATLNVDLTQYTRGFTNASLGSTYAVFNAVGGTVGLSGKTAQFTPNTGIDSIGSFYFKVTDNTGFSYTNHVNIRIFGDGSVTNAPAAPTGLNAMGGDTQVSLSWTASSGATSYHVWRSTTSGSGFAILTTIAATSFIDSDLTNNTTYYYVVTAVNALGESANSTQVSATPQLALPAVPSGLTAAAGNGQVSLNWNTASGATGYILKRSATSGSGYIGIYTNATPGYTNTGLVNGSTYYYVVTATNAAGETANSSQVSATPQIPGPTGLSATAGNAQVALSWNASVGAANYAIKRSTVNGGPYTSIATNATTTYTNTGLANNTTYYFVVSALNGPSQSTNSTQVAATPVSGSAIVVVDPPSTVVTGSAASTVTTPVTVTAGANCLVVLINNMKETATGGWAVNWNGQALTSAVVLQSGSTGAKSAVYYLYNPNTDGAAHNLSVGFTAGATAYHIQYFTLSGVDTSVVPLTGSANASGTSQTFTISGCPLNGLAALNAVNSSSSGTTTAITTCGSGTPAVTNVTGSSPCCSIGYANYIAAGTDTFTATASVSGKFVFTAAVFMPAGGGATNNAPVLSAISSRTINVGVHLSITNNATDVDAGQTLTYSLPVKPTNATINAGSGVMNWRPTMSQADTTNAFRVVVAHNGTPSLSATQSFSVIVNALEKPAVTVPHRENGRLGLSISGQVGPDYQVQSSSNLTDWITVLTTNPAAMPFVWTNSPGALPAEYYRIKANGA